MWVGEYVCVIEGEYVCVMEGAGRGQGGGRIVSVKLPPDLFKFFFCNI